jgi:hypothetical protein
MQIAGTAASGTDGKLARELRLGTSGESGCLLMPHVNPFNGALSPERVT